MSLPLQAQDDFDLVQNAFVDSFLESTKIKLDLSSANLQRIPSTGACVVVSNSLFGTVDPILLLKAVFSIRRDVVILTSFDFTAAPNLNQHISYLDADDSESQIKQRFETLLAQDLLVVVLPAKKGAISRITANMALDKRWHPKLMRVVFGLSVSRVTDVLEYRIDCPFGSLKAISRSTK